ncbi:MAG: MlaD family protein, partial [Sheuella sp.]|nr:MlaD family protein [Sheuella sp.]
VWLIPIVAALIGLSIIWNSVSKQGPKISIVFESASGLEVGKTQIRYRDVVIGMVKAIRLSPKRDSVIVDAELSKDAAGLAHSGTSFWIVKPRVGLGGVSGLSTLLSGVYIETDTNDALSSKSDQTEFVGLEQPPPITSDRPGTKFKLRAPDLGSLGAGSPIFYRRIQVGMVTSFKLDSVGKFVDMDIFIDAPYDKYVNQSTRFWNESGIDVTLSSDGVQVNTQSLVSLIAGGISFASFGKSEEAIKSSEVFKLFDTRRAAELVPEGIAVPIEMRFEQPSRGLKVGATVEFQGVDIGIVSAVDLDFDPMKRKFFTRVSATLYPERLGTIYSDMKMSDRTPEEVAKSLAVLAGRGLRAQLRSANILTGSLYIALADFPQVPKGLRFKSELPFEMPTIPADDLDKLQQNLSSIMAKLEKIPFESIGKELNDTLKEIKVLTVDFNKQVTPKLASSLVQVESSFKNLDSMIGPGSPLPANIDAAIEDIKRSVNSLRLLTDSLQSQPDSLIRGRTGQPYSRDTLGATTK